MKPESGNSCRNYVGIVKQFSKWSRNLEKRKRSHIGSSTTFADASGPQKNEHRHDRAACHGPARRPFEGCMHMLGAARGYCFHPKFRGLYSTTRRDVWHSPTDEGIARVQPYHFTERGLQSVRSRSIRRCRNSQTPTRRAPTPRKMSSARKNRYLTKHVLWLITSGRNAGRSRSQSKQFWWCARSSQLYVQPRIATCAWVYRSLFPNRGEKLNLVLYL